MHPVVRVALAFILASLPTLSLAQEPKQLSDLQQAKARILQLEAQLAQAQQTNALCEARLLMASAPQVQQAQQQQRAAIEKDAGCPIDWNANPPVCKPEPAKPLAKKE